MVSIVECAKKRFRTFDWKVSYLTLSGFVVIEFLLIFRKVARILEFFADLLILVILRILRTFLVFLIFRFVSEYSRHSGSSTSRLVSPEIVIRQVLRFGACFAQLFRRARIFGAPVPAGVVY